MQPHRNDGADLQDHQQQREERIEKAFVIDGTMPGTAITPAYIQPKNTAMKLEARWISRKVTRGGSSLPHQIPPAPNAVYKPP